MKNSDVRVGMKVVPHSKSAGFEHDLSNSVVWLRARNESIPFLWVCGYEKKESAWVLSNNEKDYDLWGDFFKAKDFDLYSESYNPNRDSGKDMLHKENILKILE